MANNIESKKDKKLAKKAFAPSKSETPQPKKAGKAEKLKATPKSEPAKKKNFKSKVSDNEDSDSDLSTGDFEALLNGAATPVSSKKENQKSKTPDQKNKTPDQKAKTPDQKTKTPDQKTKTPDKKTKTPDHKAKMPDQKAKTPEKNGSASKSKKNLTPKSSTKSPAVPLKRKRDEDSDDEKPVETKSKLSEEPTVKDSGIKKRKTAEVVVTKEVEKPKEKQAALKRKLDEDSDVEEEQPVKKNKTPKKTKESEAKKIKTEVVTEVVAKEEVEKPKEVAKDTKTSQKLSATEIANELKIKAEADKRTLFLKGIPRGITEEQIKILSKDIQEVRIRSVFSKKEEERKSFAYLIFKDEKTAEANLKLLSGKTIGKDKFTVDYVGAKSQNLKEKSELSVEELDPTRLYVRGFSPELTTEDTLKKLFPSSAEVTLPRRKDGRVIGYAFIRYNGESACKKEHDQAQGKTLNGRTIVTLFAKVLSNRKPKSDLVSKSAKAKKEVAADAKATKKTEASKNNVAEDGSDDDDDEDDDEDDESESEDDDSNE